MSSFRLEAVALILLCSVILLIAFKLGVIGGGGSGSEKSKSPFNYWLGVWTTILVLAVAIIILIGSFVAPERFHA